LNGESGAHNLPEGWTWTTIGAAAVLSKEKVDPREVPDCPYLGLEHVEAHTGRIIGRGSAKDVKSTKSSFSAGDVLYGKLRPYLNKVARPDFDGICSTDFLVFGSSPVLDNQFFAEFLSRPEFVSLAHQASSGVELPRVGWKSMAGFPMPLPPLAEQTRIADCLGCVQNRCQHIGDRLKVVRESLGRLRGAVRFAACSGHLTAAWRKEHDHVSSVAMALEASSSRRKTRRIEPAADLALPDLPDSYIVTTVGAAALILDYGTSKRCDASPSNGVPVLRMGNIQAGELVLDDLKYCDGREVGRLLLADGDLLFNRTNSPELVGKSAVFRGKKPMSFASYLIRVRFDPDLTDPDFANLWINSSYGRHWARLVKTDGVSQSNINGTKLASMPLPLPPISEQKEIVRRAHEVLAAGNRLVVKLEQAEETLDRTLRSVATKAFCGGLVSTEATLAGLEGRDFESADELLARDG
jgi:type I restriction enzyme, S subunit